MTPAQGSSTADVELTFKDIQALDGPEAVAKFFAKLGYNTAARIKQNPTNIGITASSTLRPINYVELIATSNELMQIYLFKVKSVTVAHTRALARAVARNRIEKFLLVLSNHL